MDLYTVYVVDHRYDELLENGKFYTITDAVEAATRLFLEDRRTVVVKDAAGVVVFRATSN